MGKKSWIILIIIPILLGLVGCRHRVVIHQPRKNETGFITRQRSRQYYSQQKLLAKFVRREMIHQGGIYTNFQAAQHASGTATGHEMLSESSGLWLEYLAQTHQFKAFRHFYRLTKRQFDQGDQFSYRINRLNGKRYDVNATLDDFRIIRALQVYGQLTHSHHYKYEAARRFALLKQHTIRGGRVSNFYNVRTKQHSMDSALAYYDLLTLRYFEGSTAAGKKAYQQQLQVVKKGYLGDGFPLYAGSYQWTSHRYSQQPLNTSEGLETVLHLAEVHQLNPATLHWLRQRVTDQDLFNGYSVTGVVKDKNQSAANYALAAMIFAQQGDQTGYQAAMKLVWHTQITDSGSRLYGGLGDQQTHEAYSFNNLVALLASLY